MENDLEQKNTTEEKKPNGALFGSIVIIIILIIGGIFIVYSKFQQIRKVQEINKNINQSDQIR